MQFNISIYEIRNRRTRDKSRDGLKKFVREGFINKKGKRLRDKNL